MTAEFRPLEERDIETVLGFMTQLYARDALHFDPVRVRQTLQWLMATPDAGSVWVIQAEGAAAGYVAFTVCCSIEFHGRFGLLDELYLDEAWRGKGLARQALEFVEARCRALGFQALRLETAVDNLRAQEVYRKAGFEIHDRYLMTKWLTC